jgi:hypothetical protein
MQCNHWKGLEYSSDFYTVACRQYYRCLDQLLYEEQIALDLTLMICLSFLTISFGILLLLYSIQFFGKSGVVASVLLLIGIQGASSTPENWSKPSTSSHASQSTVFVALVYGLVCFIIGSITFPVNCPTTIQGRDFCSVTTIHPKVTVLIAW